MKIENTIGGIIPITPIYNKPEPCRWINPFDLNFTNLFPNPNEQAADGHMDDWLITAGTYAAAAYATGGIGFIVGGALTYLSARYICTYTFIFSPQEYYAWKVENTAPVQGDGSYSAEVPSIDNMPYYFHCNPAYKPAALQFINASASGLGRSWGYPGPTSPLCTQGINSMYQMPEMVNKVAIGIQQGLAADTKQFFGTYSKSYGSQKDYTQVLELSPFDKATPGQNGSWHVAYYRLSDSSPRARICAGIVSLPIPLEIGCTRTSIMYDYVALPSSMQDFINGTRCKYLHDMRGDLYYLGSSTILLDSLTVGKKDPLGYSGFAMSKFLRSDLHFTSNVVGCIKDILVKKFVGDPTKPSQQNYFQLLQSQISPIIYAVFVLYVSLLGIKIISNNQPPSRGEAILYFVKLAVVAYFILGDGWYSRDKARPGLFTPLVYASDQIADLFMQAFNTNDVAGLCRFKYNNQNLLGETEVPIGAATVFNNNLASSSTSSGLTPTPGFDIAPNPIVKLSVWDLLDCHIANYMTFGSCDYSLGGLTPIWLIPICILSVGYGTLLMILCLIYVVMVFLVVFRFAHIYVISLISIAILILVSPIFLCFWLFQPTKQPFDAWLKMLLTNILYPALLFGFLALMLASFNAVYYGKLNSTPGNPQDFWAACTNPDGSYVDSMFCTSIITYTDKGSDICKVGWASIMRQKVVKDLDIGITHLKVPSFGQDGAGSFVKPLTLLAVIAIIFYHFSNEVISFMSSLLSAPSLASYSRGRVNVLSNATTAASTAIGAATTVAKSAYKSGAKEFNKASQSVNRSLESIGNRNNDNQP
jgi:type IV secretion system protein VirB6